MGDWLTEFWVVLCHSRRTQLEIAFGILFFVGVIRRDCPCFIRHIAGASDG
jgi:hypothetical protein